LTSAEQLSTLAVIHCSPTSTHTAYAHTPADTSASIDPIWHGLEMLWLMKRNAHSSTPTAHLRMSDFSSTQLQPSLVRGLEDPSKSHLFAQQISPPLVERCVLYVCMCVCMCMYVCVLCVWCVCLCIDACRLVCVGVWFCCEADQSTKKIQSTKIQIKSTNSSTNREKERERERETERQRETHTHRERETERENNGCQE